MPVGIVLVFNNTNGTLHYKNTQTDYKFTINPKPDIASDFDGYIPQSSLHDDRVPYKSSGKFISITIDDGPPYEISDSDWQFEILGPSDFQDHKTKVLTGSLKNGGKYVLRVDPNLGNELKLTFLEYEESKFQTTEPGQVISNSLLETLPAIGWAIVKNLKDIKLPV
ncbi:hypothetical protein GALMADRAFT_209934 [Galerina marginata CBS 339.88]|uniref:Uncharacterized protein n=1 Tax=Galerina marginata (strain CBS 339.88) TaxID=685588 RepID=A0A067TCM5_GALM3|nr:hypothetical protein GALMADRAFT_209934 [Galerina marginata CBS 339.88]